MRVPRALTTRIRVMTDPPAAGNSELRAGGASTSPTTATYLPGFTLPTYSAQKEIRTAVEGFLKVMTMFDADIVKLAVVGNTVLTERVDRVIFNGKSVDLPGMGAFEVSGDKITAWRDYFYMATDT